MCVLRRLRFVQPTICPVKRDLPSLAGVTPRTAIAKLDRGQKTHSYSLRNFLAASKLDTRLSICIIWQIFEKTCVHFELYRLNAAAQGSLAFKATANRERAFTLEDTQEKESLLSRPTHDNAQEILGNLL